MAVPKKGTLRCWPECLADVDGCACFEHGCWFARAAFGFVVGLRIRVGTVLCSVYVVARAKQMLCVPFVNSGEVLLEFFSIGSGGGEVHCLAAVFWWCFPELFVVVLVRVPLPLGLLLCSLKFSAVLPPWFKVFVVCLGAVALPSRFALRTAPGLFLPVVVLPQAPNCYFGNPPSTLWRSEVAMPMVRCLFSLGCLVSLGVTPGCSSPTLWRCAEVLFPHCVLLRWFCGSRVCPNLGCGRDVSLFRYFVVLYGRDSRSQEFIVGRSWWRHVRRALPAV
ncbi:hypothetical protein Taro_042753 [Colocasia esculenta]|uniref:Uncharacterized protein n=1 Tax=Colocasia esculenta TaxID=4460 RepID=A0A843WEQ4_COLES|nr:hypothetical protein [Colocasia esculenta]